MLLTVTHCHSLILTVTHWYSLSVIVTHCHPLILTISHCHPLSSTDTHYPSLSPTVTYCHLECPQNEIFEKKSRCIVSGNSPTFSNLDSTVTFPDSTTASSLMFTVAWTDDDPLDILTVAMTTTTSSFTFNTVSGVYSFFLLEINKFFLNFCSQLITLRINWWIVFRQIYM